MSLIDKTFPDNKSDTITNVANQTPQSDLSSELFFVHLFWNVAVTYMYIQLQHNTLTPYNYATLMFGHSVTMRTHTHVQNLLGDQLNMITSKVYYSFEASVVSFCQLLIFRLFNWNIINSLYIDNDSIY